MINIILQIFYNHSAHFSTHSTLIGVCSHLSVSGKCQLDNNDRGIKINMTLE